MPIHVVVDTNVYLHYVPFTQLPWKELVGTPDPIFVVPLTVIAELDEKQYSGRPDAVQRRARATIAMFSEALTHPETALSVRLLDRTPRPVDDALKSGNSDDCIIAELLQYREMNEGDVVVATDDLAMRLKLRAFGIAFVGVPDQFRIADESSVIIRDLKTKLARAEAAAPDVMVGFSGPTKLTVLKVGSENEIDADAIADRVADQRRTNEWHLEGQEGFEAGELERYHARWDRYDVMYAAFLRADIVKRLRTFKLQLIAYNKGDVAAKDTDIEISLPPDIEVMWHPLVSVLLPPGLPLKPIPIGEPDLRRAAHMDLLEEYLWAVLRREHSDYRWQRVVNISLPSRRAKLSKEQSRIVARLRVPSLMQRQNRPLKALSIVFPEGVPFRSFAIQWTALSANGIGMSSGECHVKFEQVGVSQIALTTSVPEPPPE